MEHILAFDRWLLRQINSEWTHSWLDTLLPFARNEFFWAPVYLFLFLLVTLNFRKYGWWWSLFFVCTFALTDLISTQVFKEWVQRLRPCMDVATAPYVRMLIPCSSAFGFVSSHAANHFGMATFIVFTLREVAGRPVYLAWLWALLVSYAQLYVGAHFPFDVLGGGMLGIVIGTLNARLFTRLFGPAHLNYAD